MKTDRELWKVIGLVGLVMLLVVQIVTVMGRDHDVRAVARIPLHLRVVRLERAPGWGQRDQAAYVVSLLNLPRCAGNRPLSKVLRETEGARSFGIMESTFRPNLYYVVVRQETGAVIGVYAYRFGWKMPRGVRGGRCVREAPAASTAVFLRVPLIEVGRYHTTFPES